MAMTLEQFIQKWLGKQADFDGRYGAQCVDLFNFYNRDVVQAPWIGTPVSNGARDLWEVNNPVRNHHYETLDGHLTKQPGDVLVWTWHYYGHVAIVIDQHSILQQNYGGRQYVTRDPHIDAAPAGILRPRKFISAPAPQSKPKPTTKEIKIWPGFTMWQYEHDNKIEYGTLQRLNPSLNPRLLQVGHKITVPN